MAPKMDASTAPPAPAPCDISNRAVSKQQFSGAGCSPSGLSAVSAALASGNHVSMLVADGPRLTPGPEAASSKPAADNPRSCDRVTFANNRSASVPESRLVHGSKAAMLQSIASDARSDPWTASGNEPIVESGLVPSSGTAPPDSAVGHPGFDTRAARGINSSTSFPGESGLVPSSETTLFKSAEGDPGSDTRAAPGIDKSMSLPSESRMVVHSGTELPQSAASDPRSDTRAEGGFGFVATSPSGANGLAVVCAPPS
mmetsp:Transcript_124198/g.359178  ORF Transcript_124198/g.359178 Transcript_124198/m.359178 type:complete len:257 (+) Transcript_124198:556-1326(+)